jgi:hypothetical protein
MRVKGTSNRRSTTGDMTEAVGSAAETGVAAGSALTGWARTGDRSGTRYGHTGNKTGTVHRGRELEVTE